MSTKSTKATTKAPAKTVKPVINAPRDGSRKAKVYDIFRSKGRDEAIKKGRQSYHLKESTLKMWCNTWNRSTVKKAA